MTRRSGLPGSGSSDVLQAGVPRRGRLWSTASMGFACDSAVGREPSNGEDQMGTDTSTSETMNRKTAAADRHHLRFHLPHAHLQSTFGNDWFALKAEAFARFFGTPVFLIAQTIVVLFWIGLNLAGVVKFDLYPFILLNLAFSLQSAYAAPLILLAQTRQSDRDKALAEADARHREDLASALEQRQILAEQQTT